MATNSNSSDEYRIKIVIKFDKILNNLKISKNIEKGIYNYTIDTAKSRNITRLWNDRVFYNLYMNICRPHSILVSINRADR